jgi:peptide/nickel transport system substrate-binding protein
VKFSFERYRGAAAKAMKDRCRAVEVADALRIRFRLKEPWPDFMTYYGSLATGPDGSFPRKYVQQVGDEGFKKSPSGPVPTGSCPSPRASSWCWRPTSNTGGRFRA